MGTLKLSGTKITDAGIDGIRSNFSHLPHLEIANTRITDRGLHEICRMRSLRFLDLSGTEITDYGLQELKDLKLLMYLDVRIAPRITADGVKQLNNSLPDILIQQQ